VFDDTAGFLLFKSVQGPGISVLPGPGRRKSFLVRSSRMISPKTGSPSLPLSVHG